MIITQIFLEADMNSNMENNLQNVTSNDTLLSDWEVIEDPFKIHLPPGRDEIPWYTVGGAAEKWVMMRYTGE